MQRHPTALIADDVVLGNGVEIFGFTNLYGCTIGDGTRIGNFVEVQKGAIIGERCKISSHSFICEGVHIENEVFIGHHVCFTNDVFPSACVESGKLADDKDWSCVPTHVHSGASIGSGTTLLPGITIGEGALVGAGSVVTKDVPPRAVVLGNPARIKRYLT